MRFSCYPPWLDKSLSFKCYKRPLAQDGEKTTGVGIPVVIDITTNDTFKRAYMTPVFATTPLHGSVSFKDEINIRYKPSTDYIGIDTFIYRLIAVNKNNPAEIATDEAVVNISILGDSTFTQTPSLMPTFTPSTTLESTSVATATDLPIDTPTATPPASTREAEPSVP